MSMNKANKPEQGAEVISELLELLKYTAMAAGTLALWFVKYGIHHYT